MLIERFDKELWKILWS